LYSGLHGLLTHYGVRLEDSDENREFNNVNRTEVASPESDKWEEVPIHEFIEKTHISIIRF